MRTGRLRRFVVRAVAIALAASAVLTGASVVYNHVTAAPSRVPRLDAHGHQVQTGELRTHDETWGATGSPIVLVPGFAESAYVLDALGPDLAAHHHRVYALDVRGYSYTKSSGPYSLASDTEQLADFLTALHLGRADGVSTVLVGHSSGAAIAGELALTRPTDVTGIIFLDRDGTPYGRGLRGCTPWSASFRRDPCPPCQPSPIAGRRPVYNQAHGQGCPPFTGAVADAWTRPLRVPGAASAMPQIFDQQLIGPEPVELTRIHVPAAVVYGSEDPETPAALAGETVTRLHAPPRSPY